MRLALDAMGGDHAPEANLEGAALFARENPDVELVLVGDEARVRAPRLTNVRVRHATQVVAMDEHATAAIRKKKDSSLRVCFELLKAGEADAMVSAGNSGAVMAGALLVLGRIPGVERPAFAALFPALGRRGRSLLLDAGANVDCKPTHLAQFAVMGDAYVRKLLGVARPRVGLLSNGEEDTKGTSLTREALALLRKSNLEFRGYVEGKDIFSGEVEVVVTDGFTGNVVLKASEGTAMAMASLVRSAVEKSGLSERLGALLLKPTLAGLRKMVDYAEYGGAPLLGVGGVAVVAHGRSNARAIQKALEAAKQTVEAELQADLCAGIERARAWLPKRAEARAAEEA